MIHNEQCYDFKKYPDSSNTMSVQRLYGLDIIPVVLKNLTLELSPIVTN